MLQCSIRTLIISVGLCAGWVVYSYRMFRSLAPTRSDFAIVAHCGIPRTQSAERHSDDRERSGFGSSYYCHVGRGKWIKTRYGIDPLIAAIGIVLIATFGALYRSSFLGWATRSATGTGTLLLVLFGLPVMLLGLQENHIEGTLTLDWAFRIVVLSAVGGTFMGLVGWYMFVNRFSANRE
jgi:hypothetical protein